MFGGKHCIRATILFLYQKKSSKPSFLLLFSYYSPRLYHILSYIDPVSQSDHHLSLPVPCHLIPTPTPSQMHLIISAFCTCTCSCHYHYLPGPGLTISCLPHLVFLYYISRLPPVNTAWRQGILPHSLPTLILQLTVIYFSYNLSIK